MANEEKDIDKLLKNFAEEADDFNEENPNAPESGEKSAVEHILTPEALVHSLSSITKMIARKLDFPEVELTPDDEIDLTNALMPFADKLDLLIKYMPYLPFGIFIGGYSLRIISGYSARKKEKMAMLNGKPKQPDKEQAKMHEAEKNKVSETIPEKNNINKSEAAESDISKEETEINNAIKEGKKGDANESSSN